MSNKKQSSVDAYCNGCDAFICDQLVTHDETCDRCGTPVVYVEQSNIGKKQSSVDWLIEQLIEHRYIIVNKTTYGDKVKAKHEILLEKAKAMHKEEIINATIYGDRFEGCYGLDSEQYYNETFGGNK